MLQPNAIRHSVFHERFRQGLYANYTQAFTLTPIPSPMPAFVLSFVINDAPTMIKTRFFPKHKLCPCFVCSMVRVKNSIVFIEFLRFFDWLVSTARAAGLPTKCANTRRPQRTVRRPCTRCRRHPIAANGWLQRHDTAQGALADPHKAPHLAHTWPTPEASQATKPTPPKSVHLAVH